MKKMLMLASVASMIDQFNMSNIDILKKQGYEVHIAANFGYGNTSSKQRVDEFKKELKELNVPFYHVDFSRKITNILSNIKAYKQIKNLMLKNKYKFVHCHSPIGGVCGRIAGHSTSTPVIYTAHGFYFFKVAPLKNWLLSYPVERYLARWTDVLITINKEDYARAKKSFKAGRVKYIPGVGLDTRKFSEVVVDRLAKRRELKVPEEAIVLLSVGELNRNKNHEVIIRAISNLNKSNIYYIICGQGPLENHLRTLSKKLGLEKYVKLLGYRKDLAEVYKSADIFAFPSRREGLGLAALEAMASGLPIVTSNVHGIVDYSVDGVTGYTCSPTDISGFVRAIERLSNNDDLKIKMGQHNTGIVKNFDIENVRAKMIKIYGVMLSNEREKSKHYCTSL